MTSDFLCDDGRARGAGTPSAPSLSAFDRMRGVKIEPFLLERSMTRHETHVRYDIAESGILPLSVNDLLDFEPPADRALTLERLLSAPLGYSEARGTEELRTALGAAYSRADADHILVTT